MGKGNWGRLGGVCVCVCGGKEGRRWGRGLCGDLPLPGSHYFLGGGGAMDAQLVQLS